MKFLAVVVLSFWAGLAGALSAHAQSITTIYAFTNGPVYPVAGLTLGPDGNFYGSTLTDGDGSGSGNGNLFKVTTNGLLTILVSFNETNGRSPSTGLTLGPDGNFYGTTYFGGSYHAGTVFQVTTNGTLTTLVNFNNTNGNEPYASLTLGPDGNLYGTSFYGNSSDGNGGIAYGNVFEVTTNGKVMTLVTFTNNSINGAHPAAALALGLDGNFYGTTEYGGTTDNNGTVFQVTTNGTLTTLVNFNNTNGAYPLAGLTLGPDGNFYGTTSQGGSYNDGTVFQLTTNGKLMTLVNFNINNGAYPQRGFLTLGPDGNFYGTTALGGSSSNGTIFMVTTNGTLTTLASFNGTNGAKPQAGLTLGPDGNFYGTTYQGGSANLGTIFELELPPDFITAATDQTLVIGGSTTFNCQMFGTAPFAYQWLSNGVPIAGATNANLNFSPALASEAGNYQLVVTNSYGSITSQVATLNVLLQPNTYAISNSGGGNCTVYLGSYPNSTNRIWVTTNPARPFAQWQLISTNITDGNGLGQFLDTNTGGVAQKFYRLSYP